VLVIGYLHKSRGMLRWLGREDWCVAITEVEAQELVSKVEQLLCGLDIPGPHLVDRVEVLRRACDSLPSLLRSTWRAAQHPSSQRDGGNQSRVEGTWDKAPSRQSDAQSR
jgi:hypothetical protein